MSTVQIVSNYLISLMLPHVRMVRVVERDTNNSPTRGSIPLKWGFFFFFFETTPLSLRAVRRGPFSARRREAPVFFFKKGLAAGTRIPKNEPALLV